MVAVGRFHTVLLRSDGCAVAYGRNGFGQCSFPLLGRQRSYVQASAADTYTVLLRDDGCAVVCGDCSLAGEVLVPEIGTRYTYAATSRGGVLLVRSDGRAILHDAYSCHELLEPPVGAVYVQGGIMDGGDVFLLRSDGQVDEVVDRLVGSAVCRTTERCDEFSTASGKRISIGESHAVLLSTDGLAFTCGSNFHGQCNVPPLAAGTTYVQVSAGIGHTVLLRSDGCAVACGLNDHGQCQLPEIREGVTVVQVGAGGKRTVLLCSDGSVLSCGLGAQTAPPLFGPQAYVAEVGLVLGPPQVVVQLVVTTSSVDGLHLELLSMAGERVANWELSRSSFANAFACALSLCPLKVRARRVGFLLPNGSSLPEQWTCAQLVNTLSEGSSSGSKRAATHESDAHAVKKARPDCHSDG